LGEPKAEEDYDLHEVKVTPKAGSDKVESRLPTTIMDLALLVNAYKNVSAVREIASKEWLILQSVERKLSNLLASSNNVVSPYDLTMIIYGFGTLDMGSKQTWELLERLLIQNFSKLKKIDFD
jgi:hypothetical protein